VLKCRGVMVSGKIKLMLKQTNKQRMTYVIRSHTLVN